MLKTDNSPTPDAQIRKAKMRLTVTNISPPLSDKEIVLVPHKGFISLRFG